MNSDNPLTENSINQQLEKFLSTFHKHWQNTYPKVFQASDILKQIQRTMLSPSQPVKQVDVEEIEKKLVNALKSTPKLNKNGILIIGPPGVGKTSFMKFYARKHFKILINANCCQLISTFRNQTIDVIDILFQMANFQKDTLLFFDEIDILMNDQNSFQNMQSIRKTLIKNLNRKDYLAPVIYSTNKPWKIKDKDFLSTIHCSIQISVSSYEKRKELIKMILEEDCNFSQIDLSEIDVDDIAQRTLNYLNSDIYVLVRQIMMEPYRQMIQKGATLEQIEQQNIQISKQNIQKAYEKIKPSILVQQISQYKDWRQKFQQQGQ